MNASQNGNGNSAEWYEAALPQRAVADSPTDVLCDAIDIEAETGFDQAEEIDTPGGYPACKGNVASRKGAGVLNDCRGTAEIQIGAKTAAPGGG